MCDYDMPTLVSHEILQIALRKSLYREKLIDEVNARMKRTPVKRSFWVFSWKISQQDNVRRIIANDWSYYWEMAFDLGYISGHEYRVIHKQALPSDFLSVRVQCAKEVELPPEAFFKLRETILIEEDVWIN